MTPLDRRTALVTGAGSGIGAATALLLARQGAHVCCTDLDLAAAEATARAAVGMLIRAAAKECREAGLPIRVCAVSPAGVRTPMWRSMPFFQDLMSKTGTEQAAFEALEQGGGGPFAQPEDVARAVAFLVSEDARYINGVELMVDGGFVL